MRTIHKFALPDTVGEYEVTMPRNADILCVQMQRGYPYLWALVDDAAPEEKRHVAVIGTGWELPAGIGRSEYLGTYQVDGGFVWHVFVTKPNVLGDGR
jgi:hypothetical protein